MRKEDGNFADSHYVLKYINLFLVILNFLKKSKIVANYQFVYEQPNKYFHICFLYYYSEENHASFVYNIWV